MPNSLFNITKPILWIHLDHEVNARHWQDFNSRNTRCLNQPYLNLLIKNIIKKCEKNFHVILLDDSSYKDTIP